jgi:hypothetical protein
MPGLRATEPQFYCGSGTLRALATGEYNLFFIEAASALHANYLSQSDHQASGSSGLVAKHKVATGVA